MNFAKRKTEKTMQKDTHKSMNCKRPLDVPTCKTVNALNRDSTNQNGNENICKNETQECMQFHMQNTLKTKHSLTAIAFDALKIKIPRSHSHRPQHSHSLNHSLERSLAACSLAWPFACIPPPPPSLTQWN